MTEPTDLADKRAEHRQQLRDESPDVLVALPDTEGDLTRALADVEEVLLLVDGDDDDERDLPAPLADRRANGGCGEAGRICRGRRKGDRGRSPDGAATGSGRAL